MTPGNRCLSATARMIPFMSLIALATAACGGLSVSVGTGSGGTDARLTAHMQDVAGYSIGTVVMEEAPTHGFLVTVMLEGLEPGFHGIHIHTIGSCSPDFKASGGHINVDNKQHGLLNPDGTG